MANGKDAQGQQTAPSGASDDRIFAAIAYVLGLLIALVIYFVKKDSSREVRFHAMQAILLDVVIVVVNLVMGGGLIGGMFVLGVATGGVGFLALPIVWVLMVGWSLLIFCLRIFLAYKAYQGEMFKVPLLGDQCERMTA